MSDSEEKPPEETEEDGETEMEEDDANYPKIEEDEEEEYDPNSQRLEGGGEENGDYQKIEDEGEDHPYYPKTGEDEDDDEDGGDDDEEEEEYDPSYLRLEGGEEHPDHQKVTDEQQESEEDTVAGEGLQEEEAALAEEMEAQAGEGQEEEWPGEQEEAIPVPQEVSQAGMSLEQLLFPGSHSSTTPLKKHRGSRSEHALEPEASETLELAPSEFPDLDQEGSEEPQPSGAPAEERGQPPGDDWRRGKGVADSKLSQESLVASSTEEALFQTDDSAKVFPLTMTWTFGWNSSLPVFSIRDENQRVLLYVCAHTAVIYDVFKNSQHHLQGHANVISCLCVSEDRRWIATADKGPDCLIIIWDSFTGIPVHTIFDSCPEGNGIKVIAITRDAKYLATISDGKVQKICIWKWTLAVETPACSLNLNSEYGFQNYLTFNPTNNKELVSSSRTRAIYYSWCEEKNTLVHSAPLLTEKTFNKLVGKFSQSVFHPKHTQLLSATTEGKLVVWDIHRPPLAATSSLDFPYIKPCKLVHLQKEAITVLTTVDSYIVTGDIKGNIKFYDGTLSIVNWFSHFRLSPIRTLSFSKTSPPPPTEKSNYPPDCTLKGDFFIVRNFIIATSDATVYHLTADGTKLEKLFVEPKDAICAVACHPYQPLLAIGSFCGMVKVWDYESKTYLFSRVFEKGLGVQSLTYNPEGAILGAGFTEGTVYILDAMSLESESTEPFRYSRSSVTHISFSHDSQYMATADMSYTVALYRVVVRHGRRVWEYLARLRSHRKSIRSLLFGVHLDSNEPRLLSLGKDRLLIEYNLLKTCRDHLEVLDIHRTDQGCYPTCMLWYPPLTKELFLLVCNSGYKVKLFNSTTKMCRALDAGVSLGGEGLIPFYGLVAGGKEGPFYRELEDYFYYSQLRSQGIDTMETRKVSEHICLSELPSVMRAIGFYPSEEMIDNMFNEIKFGEYVDTGKLVDKINLPDFLKVYLNHRPPFGNSMGGIQHSFDVLGYSNSEGKKAIQREDLLRLLLTKGEHMTQEEMVDCFATLLGMNPEGWKSEPATSSFTGPEISLEEQLPDEITAEIFATDILGLTISEDSRQDHMVSEV
ncbi:cilia- and flagella-associated protein 251 [Orycteropus afer afer]|uniref:Cilia- and flagella-associated protein 251 n=1 Tax=Orycteropus afer afer TaxID=1230840 RepID=A0AC54Z9K2_ORYAF|nr:cilia- and flagella-associated protein 251 [Orycteropus afer afer]